MLIAPDLVNPYRIIGIDPGTDTLGVAVLDVDVDHQHVIVSRAETFSGKNMAKGITPFTDIHGERQGKLYMHRMNLLNLFHQLHPDAVISEAPFMGRFPQAYAALVECLATIRSSLVEYDPWMPLETVDPPTAKKAVGVAGKGSSKEDVMAAIQRLPRLQYSMDVNPSLLDEHACDAIAVAYHRVRLMFGL